MDIMTADTRESRTIRTNILKHKSTDLLVATSPDLPGLYVAGRSEEQIQLEIPGAIREMFEAAGARDVEVSPVDEISHTPSFDVRARTFNAELLSA